MAKANPFEKIREKLEIKDVAPFPYKDIHKYRQTEKTQLELNRRKDGTAPVRLKIYSYIYYLRKVNDGCSLYERAHSRVH